MALLRPYCTLLDVQQQTKNSGAAVDDVYEVAINLASRWVEDYCGKWFWFHNHAAGQTAYRVPRSRVFSDMILLPFPIITLTKVWTWSDKVAGKTDSDLYDDDEYYYEGGSPQLHTQAGHWGAYPFKGFIDIEGTFGYPLTDDVTPPPTLPAEIRRATTLAAAALSGEDHKEEVGLDGSNTQILDTRIPVDARMLLKRWREVIDYAL